MNNLNLILEKKVLFCVNKQGLFYKQYNTLLCTYISLLRFINIVLTTYLIQGIMSIIKEMDSIQIES